MMTIRKIAQFLRFVFRRVPGRGNELALDVELLPSSVWDEVAPRWKKALALEPTSARILNNLGIAYEQRGQYHLAEDNYRRALALAPNNHHIRRNYELFKRGVEERAGIRAIIGATIPD